MSADAQGMWAPHYTTTVAHLTGHGACPTRTVAGAGTLTLPTDGIISRTVLSMDRYSIEFDIPATDELTIRFRIRQTFIAGGAVAATNVITLFNESGQEILAVQYSQTDGVPNPLAVVASSSLGNGGILGTDWLDYSISVRLDGSTGAVHSRTGGTTLFSDTNVDTEGTGAGPCTRFRVSKLFGTSPARFTDFVWTDTYEDWMGTPGTVRYHAPNEDEGNNGWSALSATEGAHYTEVDEDEADGDTSYLEATTNGLVERFKADDPGIASASSASAVGVLMVGTKPDSGAAQVNPDIQIGSGGTPEQLGAVDISDLTYGTSHKIIRLNPDTSLPYTGAELADAYIGMTSVI